MARCYCYWCLCFLLVCFHLFSQCCCFINDPMYDGNCNCNCNCDCMHIGMEWNGVEWNGMKRNRNIIQVFVFCSKQALFKLDTHSRLVCFLLSSFLFSSLFALVVSWKLLSHSMHSWSVVSSNCCFENAIFGLPNIRRRRDKKTHDGYLPVQRQCNSAKMSATQCLKITQTYWQSDRVGEWELAPE